MRCTIRLFPFPARIMALHSPFTSLSVHRVPGEEQENRKANEPYITEYIFREKYRYFISIIFTFLCIFNPRAIRSEIYHRGGISRWYKIK